jgi:hypothetical protein
MSIAVALAAGSPGPPSVSGLLPAQSSGVFRRLHAEHHRKLAPQVAIESDTRERESSLQEEEEDSAADLSLDSYVRTQGSVGTVAILFPSSTHPQPISPVGSNEDAKGDRTRFFDVNQYLWDLLKCPAELEAFLDFGKKCFNEENIHFYVDVLRFKKSTQGGQGGDEDLAGAANLVIDRYLTSGARFEVPFRKQAVIKMKRKIATGKIDEKLFDAPLRESTTIIRLDIFPKYVLYWYASQGAELLDDAAAADEAVTEVEGLEAQETLMERLMQHGVDSVAGELARIARGLLVKIGELELLGKAWTKPNKHIKAPNVRKMIQNFNKVHDVVTSEIVRQPDKTKRAAILRFFIDVAETCQTKYHDYESMLAIVSAFDSAAVHRLKPTWKALGKKPQVSA